MTDRPKRIQRRRTKGWRLPDGCVYVGRPTKWGNPFICGPGENKVILESGIAWLPAILWTTAQVVEMYQEWVLGLKVNDPLTGAHLPVWHLLPDPPKSLAELRGKDLACFCPLDQPCHADVLLELANGESAVT